MKKFISVNDIPDVNSFAQLAMDLKKNPLAYIELGKSKTLGLIFFNPSLRTRLSTQRAAYNLGMNVIVMNIDKEGWKIEFNDGAVMDGDSQEHIKDAAGVISQYCDIIGIRTFAGLKNREEDYGETVLNKFAKNVTVPVLSLESATLHPLQSFADLMTIEEHKKVNRPKVVLTWAPHPRALPQAVPNSFVQWMKKSRVDLTVTHPSGYELSEEFMDGVKVTHNQDEALAGADFVYAKNWSSFNDYGKILSTDKSWMITSAKMALTNNGHFMHCLPVRRNVIVTDEVMDGKKSLVLQQAENRIYAAQVILQKMLAWKK